MSAELNAMNHPQANAAEQSRMELQARLNGLGGLNGRKLDPETKAKKLREACEGFESIFIQKMWQEMRNTVPKANLMHGKEERFWQDMYDQELSKSMTKAGGIGLADMMYEQLSRGLANASKGAAGQTVGQAFTPTAAPLINPALAEVYSQEAPAAPEKPGPVAASIYEAPEETEKDQAEEIAAAKPEPSQERRRGLTHSDTHTRQPGTAQSASPQADLAYLARRDAGDKLGSNAVRPSLRQKPVQAAKPVQQAEPAAPAHGTGESLAKALELAKTGAGIQPGAAQASLAEVVSQAKARNAKIVEKSGGLSQTTTISTPVDETLASAEAGARKVRYTTNIPGNAKNGKKSSQAIRMLNVDNASVNSNQGKGLAAYHAAQEKAASEAGQAQTPVAPLKASQPEKAEHPTFTIPPLRSGDLLG